MTLSTLLRRPLLLLLSLVLVGCGDTVIARAPSGTAEPAVTTADIVERRDGYALAGDSDRGDVFPRVYAELQPGARLGLTTYGSSSSGKKPVRVRYDSRSSIEVLVEGPDGVTADYAPRTFVLQLDAARIDTTAPLSVHLEGVGDKPLEVTAKPVDRRVRIVDSAGLGAGPPAREPHNRPTVTPVANGLAVTTYGSSSCPTVPVEMEVRERSIVELWLHPRMDGDGCTEDISPTTSIVAFDVSALDSCDSVEVRLSQYGQDPVSTHVMYRQLADTRETCPAATPSGP